MSDDEQLPPEKIFSAENARIRSAHDLRSLPGYREQVDPKSEPLKRIVRHYYLSELTPCGLSGCRQPHKDGYLVEFESGGFTNVGNVCGKGFGEKFSTEKAAYDERILRPRLTSKLGPGKTRVEQARSALDDLAERVRVLIRRRKGLHDKFPVLHADLQRRANQGQPDLFEEVERSNEEIDNALAMSPGQKREALRYQQVRRGRIVGLAFVTASPISVLDLRTRSAEFRDLEGFHAMAIDKLLEWERWLDDFEAQVKRAERMVTDGEAFFKESNLTQLQFIARNAKEKREIARIKPVDLEQDQRAAVDAKQPQPPSRGERMSRKFLDWASKLNPK